MEIRTNLSSIVYKKVTLWLMCCYKLERSVSEDAQQLVSAKKNLHHEFLRLPVIQVFRKPVQNPWFIKDLSVLNEQCFEQTAAYTQDFLWILPILLLLCDFNCNVQHVHVLCLCSFIMQNSILQYLSSQRFCLTCMTICMTIAFLCFSISLFLKID